MKLLETALQSRGSSRVTRIFHGPGDAPMGNELTRVAIDRFEDHYWVHYWADAKDQTPSEEVLEKLKTFLSQHKAKSAVLSLRPLGESPQVPTLLLGDEMPEPFTVNENGVLIEIRFKEMRHPGLFLDHAPLRAWLKKSMKGAEVLNTFAYTGSLSMAAAVGRASQVTTVDLSATTLEWAKRNAEINKVSATCNEWFAEDFFEFAKRSAKKARIWDCVILDPPSFSRSKSGTFSTQKDLKKLHVAALELVGREGYLVTSINSEKISREYFWKEIDKAVEVVGARIEIVSKIELPPQTFPTPARRPEKNYLKGWILRRIR